jgi:hypothetical protein
MSLNGDGALDYNFSIYTDGGVMPSFLAGEYVLSTFMEWITCGLLLSTYFTSLMGGEVLREEGEAGHGQGGIKQGEMEKYGDSEAGDGIANGETHEMEATV